LLENNRRQMLGWWHCWLFAVVVVSGLALSLEPLHHGVEWLFALLEPASVSRDTR